MLLIPFGQRLDRVWAENAESAADEYAARTGGNRMALNLASALVKIARIVPPDTQPAMPAGAFLLTKQVGDVNWRVRRLLQLTEDRLLPAKYRWLGFSFWLYLILFLTIGLLAANHNFLRKIHDVLEGVVHILQ